RRGVPGPRAEVCPGPGVAEQDRLADREAGGVMLRGRSDDGQIHLPDHENDSRFRGWHRPGPRHIPLRDGSACSTDGPGDHGHDSRTSSWTGDPITMWDFPLFPERGSTLAGRVDLVFFAVLVISVFFTALIGFLITFLAIRYRQGSRADRSNAFSTN